jgi:ATP/maltotriose-dependent transcriptional regulator MalT
LHLTIARVLRDRPELSGSRAAAAAELAPHFHAAGELAEALAGSLDAASLAEAVYAPSEALAQYERALALWDRVQPDADRVPIVRRAAVVADLAGFSERAIELARETLARVDPQDAVSLAHAHERLGRFLWSGGLGEDALAEYARAVELVPAERTLDRAVVLAAEGQVLMLSGRPDESEPRCQEALQIARALGADLVEAHVLNTQCPNFSARGNFEAAVAASRGALQIARGIESAEEMGRAYTNGSHALDEAGRVADSIALSREGVRAAGEFGAVRQFGEFLLAELANRLIRTACWDEAEAILDDLVEGGASGVNAGNIHVSRMQLQLGRGDLEAASSLAEAESHVSRSGSPMWAGPLAVGRMELELFAGRPAGASAAAARGVETIRRSGFVFLTARVYEIGARACAEVVAAMPGDAAVRKRESARARELLGGLDWAIARVAGTPPPLALAARATCAAECSRIDGADPDAWEAAQRQWEAIGDSYQAAYARLRRAEALLLAGARRAAAVTHVAEALAVANELGARPLREQLEALARRARLPLDSSVPTSTEGGDRLARLDLTPRELEVFALVGEGLTNREIAGELFISPKTASVHVSRILTKLSVPNRAGAAAAAQRLGVVRVAGE